MLTMEVEQLASLLGEPGAEAADLADSVAFLRRVSTRRQGRASEIRADWLPYLEARLQPTIPA
jgi:hypothetical protein